MSVRTRKRIKKWSSILFFSFLILFIADYFLQPLYDKSAHYTDHAPTYLFFGAASVIGTYISVLVLLRVSSREVNTLTEYLDIFNEIIDSVKKGENFYILSPAHNTGQRDSTLDPVVKKKYELNQALLLEKAGKANGEYTMLDFQNNEFALFGNGAGFSDRSHLIEKCIKNPEEYKDTYSLLFWFLMNFSKQIGTLKEVDKRIIDVQEYINQAYIHLEELIRVGLKIKTIQDKEYMDAPLVLIISKELGYFGLYKLTDAQSNAIVRGIKISDKNGLDTLRVLYKAMAGRSTIESKTI